MKRTALALALLLPPAAAEAQLPDPSPRAVALGGAYTALARGYEAGAWNPAMLAARGNPGFTLAAAQLAAEVGSNTYSWRDILDYQGRRLSDEDKAYLLGRISLDDSLLTLRGGGGLTAFGFSVGSLALSMATSGDVEMSVGRDAVELALYGNAHRSGPGEFFSARGSSGRAWLATTVATSLGVPFELPAGRLAVGATYKWIVGHFLGRAREISSSFAVNPLLAADATGEAIYTDYPDDYSPDRPEDVLGGLGKAGSGYGVDIGATLQLSGRSITLSAVLVNALHRMTWDDARFTYERAARSFRQTATGEVVEDSSNVLLLTPAEISADPSARALHNSLLANASFARLARVGVALRSGQLTLAADAHLRLSDGLDRQPAQHVSAGLEYLLLGILPLRAGVGTDFGESLTLSAGTGLHLLGLRVDISAAAVTGAVRPGAIIGVGAGLQF